MQNTCNSRCYEPPPDCDPFTGCVVADITGRQAVRDITGNAIDCPDGDCENPPSDSPNPSPSSSSNCVCRDSREDVTPESNPDDSESACGCIQGSEFSSSICCGDDAEDCARATPNNICSMNLNIGPSSARWVDTSSNRGDTVYIPCAGTLYLSDGSTWFKCNNVFEGVNNGPSGKIIKAGNNEYLCMGFGRRSVVECCGNGQCQSEDSDVKKLRTGETINPIIFTSEPRPSFNIISYSNAAYPPLQRPPDLGQMPGNRKACTSPIGSCDAPPGEIKYESDVRSAISSYISGNSRIASARNNDFNAVKDYLNGVAAVLRSRPGFEAGRAKNCNDNEAADAIIVRK